MSRMDELKEYKDLLDKGAINEDDFEELKRSVLGLKDKAADEIDTPMSKPATRVDLIREEALKRQSQLNDPHQDMGVNIVDTNKGDAIRDSEVYSDVKAKELAKLEALQEHRGNKLRGVSGVIKSLALWFLTVFFGFMTLGIMIGFSDGSSGIVDMFLILPLVIILGLMSCPWASDKVDGLLESKGVLEHKSKIAAVLTILMFLIMGTLT